MNAAWDGRPQNPEQSGWHWLATPTHGPVLCKWKEHQGFAGDWRWHYENGDDISRASLEVSEWRYLGPCLTPAEHEALVADIARKDAALRMCLEQAEACWLNHYGANPDGSAVPEHIAAARAALAPEPGA